MLRMGTARCQRERMLLVVDVVLSRGWWVAAEDWCGRVCGARIRAERGGGGVCEG